MTDTNDTQDNPTTEVPDNAQSIQYTFKVWAEGVVTQGTGPDPTTLRADTEKEES